MSKEAKARIKINRLLEDSGWRFFDDKNGKASISLENNVRITETVFNEFGENFERVRNGFVDFLLLDEKGFPVIVLEAKSEDKNPLSGKEQARKYARSQNCRFIILSNGNIHYFWDTEKGNPYIISKFPEPDSIKEYKNYKPDTDKLINENISKDYIVLTQKPDYMNDPAWTDESQREAFIEKNNLRFLRDYQIRAIKKIQEAVKESKDRFLFEMATGTGKTLTAAAVMKLFLRTGNASRVLFLVDRLELEDQANKAFVRLLKNDLTSVIYKEKRDDWHKAEIVVTTVQSLLFNNKYQKLFSPTDFDMIISDEAHRSIGGNARAVFEYFIGYKLGLTATPKDYLKKVIIEDISMRDPRDVERRMLLDTYRTFGCENGEPTFRYSLIDGVKEGHLVNPYVIDARTGVTTRLLSEQGFAVIVGNEDGGDEEQIYKQRDFEKKFFSDQTNMLFCKTFIENALRDPVSGEIGKTIVFTVSQNHAAKITQYLNIFADKMFPGRYNSDFALQVTSHITDAQQFTINFTNNNLSGSGNFIQSYLTGKTRVCVTVGMMTTGYDCPDILNLCLMRPIFSPTDFIQIKGRGTRKHNFPEQLHDRDKADQVKEPQKKNFKMFDFFANCEYFEEKFNYDEEIKLPAPGAPEEKEEGGGGRPAGYENINPDMILSVKEEQIGEEGMKIDRMFFNRFEDAVRADVFITKNAEEGNWEEVIKYINNNIMDRPEEYYTLEKLRKAAGVDRRISLREIIEKAMGFIPGFKSKDELLEEEFQKFISDYKPDDPEHIVALKYFFKAYITDSSIREIIEKHDFTKLSVNPSFTTKDYKAVPEKWRKIIPEYIKDYVVLNRFMG